MFVWLSWLIATAFAQEERPTTPVEEMVLVPEAPPAQATRSISLIYTGARGGVGSGRYPFYALRRLQRGPQTISSVALYHGALAQDGWAVWTPDHRVQPLLDALAGGNITCGAPDAVPAVQTEVDLTLLLGETSPAAAEVLATLGDVGGEAVALTQRRCVAGSGAGELILVGPAAGEPVWELSRFEFRQLLEVGVAEAGTLTMLGIPIQEASRSIAQIRAAQAEEPGALFVDAGNFVDGASAVQDGALSLHRPLGLEVLAQLKPAALAPGYNELVAGAKNLLGEAAAHGLPYTAANWQTTDPALTLPQVIWAEAPGPAGERPLRVAFLGMLDPQLGTLIPALKAEGVTITDPVPAVQAVVDAIYSSAAPPDAVVVLSMARSEVLEQARRQLRGVDLLVGDQTFATLRVVEREVTLRPLSSGQKGAPLTLSLDGLATAGLTFQQDIDETVRLTAVRTSPLLVRGEQPLDAAFTARVTGVRAQVYPPLDRPLLPDLGGNGQPMTQAAWSALVCEAVRDIADADTVYLHDLPAVSEIPGPLSELRVVDQLALLDTVQLHDIPGTAYGNLLNKASGMSGLVQCGARTSSDKARGRAIEPTRTYRIATTDRTAATHPVGGLLAGARPTRVLDGPGVTPLLGPDGEPSTLRAAVLRQLRTIRREDGGPEAIAAWWAAAPTQLPPMWLLRVRQLSLQASRFQGTDNPAFAAVPETLATSPSSYTLGSVADVALDYSAPSVLADLRVRSAFTTLRTEADETDTESADDLRFSTSLAVPAWTFPVHSTTLRARPYTEMLFDTEFTPTEAEDGTLNSRQADLSLALGLSSPSWGMLSALRLAGFANRDLAQLQDKPTEFGGKLEWATTKSVSTALTWTTLGDLQVYANTPDDDPSDLRFRGLAETRFSLPLARWLNIDLYAQGFALQGRHPDNDAFGLSYTLGSSLDVIGAFAL